VKKIEKDSDEKRKWKLLVNSRIMEFEKIKKKNLVSK